MDTMNTGMDQKIYMGTCDTKCGFVVHSPNKTEVIRMKKQHGEQAHGAVDLTEEKVAETVVEM